MSETFEQFCERMSHVEKTDELIVGPRYKGDTRTIFEFEGQHCHLETFDMPFYGDRYTAHTPPIVRCILAIQHPPSSHWIHSRLFYTKKRAKMLAKHYGAKSFDEDPYPRDEGVWFYLVFKEFEDLMRLVWDIHTGEFKRLFGDEAKEYQSCIGYLKDA